MNTLDRLGIMAEITRRKKGRTGQLGKTSLLKLLYLLQEIHRVPLGYRFTLYTYGPYDAAVMSDIDFADLHGVIRVSYQQEGGYKIEEGPDSGRVSPPSELNEAIAQLVDRFGNMTARELELRSTIIFVAKEARLIQKSVKEIVADVKPKYSAAEIDAAIRELQAMGAIAVPG